MAGPSVVSGIAGGALNVPGSRPLPQQGGGRFLEFARMMAQVKGNKQQQARQEAMDVISAIAQGIPVDPEDAQKKIEKGFNIKMMEGEQLDDFLNRVTGEGGQRQGAPAAKVPQSVTAQDVTSAGAAAQPPAGAQAAFPPSRNAALKAPGGGVVKGATAPGTGTVEQLFTQAQENPMEKFGALAPLYEGAISQAQVQQVQKQLETELTNLQLAGAGGDGVAMGRYILLTKGKINDSTVRGLIAATGTDKERQQVYDLLLGNEDPAAHAERLSRVQVAMLGNDNFMGRFKDPADAARFAKSIVDNGIAPPDITYRRSAAEMGQEVATAEVLIDAGLDAKRAFSAAEMQTLGIPISESLPEGMKSLTQIRMETARVNAEAARLHYAAELAKLDAAMTKAGNEEIFKRFNSYVAFKRAGVDIPDELEQAMVGEIAAMSGMTVEKANNFWHWLTGGTHLILRGGLPEGPGETTREGAGGPVAGIPPRDSMGQRLGTSLRMLGRAITEPSAGSPAAKAEQEKAMRRARGQ